MSNEIRPLLANVLLGLAVTGLSLIAAEGLLRRFSPLDIARSRDFLVPHAVLGWVGEPGKAFRYRVPGRETLLVAYNSLGLTHPSARLRSLAGRARQSSGSRQERASPLAIGQYHQAVTRPLASG